MLGARLVLEHTSTTRFRTACDMLVDAVGPAREWPPYTREATSLEGNVRFSLAVLLVMNGDVPDYF